MTARRLIPKQKLESLTPALEREVFRSYMRRSDKAVFFLDENNQVAAVNQYGCYILGLDERTVIGQPFIEALVDEQSAEKVGAVIEALKKQIGQDPRKDTFRFKKGTDLSDTFAWRLFGVQDNKQARFYVLAVGENIQEQLDIQAVLERRNAILQAITVAADHFLLATPEVWERNVIAVLKQLGQARQADRVYLCKNKPLETGSTGVYLKYEWKVTNELHVFEGDEAPIRPYEAVGLGRWAALFAKREVICEEVQMLPLAERQWNVAPEARSLVVIPVFINDEWWGYLGFEDWQQAKQCAPAEIEALKAVALLFSTAVKRKRMEEELQAEKVSVEAKVTERTRELTKAQKQVNEAMILLQLEKARLTASIHSLSLGFVMTDLEGTVLMFNHAVNDILGRSEAPWTINLLQERFGERVELRSQIGISVAQVKEILLAEMAYREQYLSIRFTPIRLIEGDGRVIGVVMLIEDVTEAKRLQQARDEFFAVASHELRTPLTAIKGNVAMIQHYFPEVLAKTDVKNMLADILASTVRLIALVNENLEVSRLEMNKIAVEAERLEMVELVRGVMEGLKTSAQEKNLDWQLQVPDHYAAWAKGDKERAEQVVLNLLGNAIKYTFSGGVYIKILSEEGWVRVHVYDTGVGIAPEEQAGLFQKFKRVGDRVYARDVSQGTGMGLYISRLLAEAMGGSVNLEKSVPGQGTGFVFQLPAA